MSDIAIHVENLGKLYRMGQLVGYGSLQESLTNVLSAPFRHFRQSGNKKPKDDYIWALKDASFEVKHGEVIGVIGRNGAGKSTLLKILTRITPPTEGHAEIHGRVGALLEVGTGFHPELTGRENIFLNGAILGMKKVEIERKFDEIIAFSGVERFIDTPLKRYSTGMQVRLAFSVAAQLEPEIMLVDEVLAVGDAAFQKKCLGKMENVSKQGRTILFVSHNMQAVRALCPRSILLKEGRIIADGPTADIVLKYYSDLGLLKVGADTEVRNSRNRRGSGAVRFTEIHVQNKSGEQCSSYMMGSTIQFVLSYQVFAEVDDLLVAIQLRSGKSGELVTSAKYPVSREKLPPGHTGSVLIEFPDVNLRPGEYPLYFWLGRPGQPFDVVDDLTVPLIIGTDRDSEDLGFDPTGYAGFFNIESRLVSCTQDNTEGGIS